METGFAPVSLIHGFEMEEKFGNFERKPFAGGDPKQIVVCRPT